MSDSNSSLPARLRGDADPRVPAGADPSFLGVGFSWPFGVDATGAIRMSDPVDELDRSIELILMTAPGERVMRPRFGCAIWDYMFDTVNATLIGMMRDAVYKAVETWEPRVTVMDVRPVPDPDNQALINIEISYVVKQTNDRRNLVYPFYMIPHDTEE